MPDDPKGPRITVYVADLAALRDDRDALEMELEEMSEVAAARLAALTSLLEKAGEALRPFVSVARDGFGGAPVPVPCPVRSVLAEIEAYKRNQAPTALVKASGTGERE